MKSLSYKTQEALTRWADKIYPSKEAFLKALTTKKKLVFYIGVDPTAPHLHLGHSTNLFLLKRFQELGHKIILLIGDFTARIGDPTGKDRARKPLTTDQITRNHTTYQQQAAKILNFKSKKNPVELKFNSKWLDKLRMKELIKLTANFTQGYMIKRSMFQKRLKEKKEIYLHEFLYPLFQGYDSVAMNVDAEVGGTDQTFNMLIGRDLVKIYKNKEKFVITTPLLINPKTGRKLMSKTESFIGLDFPPNELYGRIMALPDEVIIDCFKMCTDVPLALVKEAAKNLRDGKTNPRDLKARLASEVVKIYYGEKTSLRAEQEFNKIFKKRGLPSKVLLVPVKRKELNLLDLLTKTKLAPSRSEAKRLVVQKGVKINGQVRSDWQKTSQLK